MSKYTYSLKDKKLSIWSFTTQTVKGVPQRTYHKECSLIWAYYRHNGGTANLTGTAIRVYDEDAEALFVINKRPVQINWLVIYDHKIFEITRLDDFEGYNDDLKLLCRMAKIQNFSSYNGLIDD